MELQISSLHFALSFNTHHFLNSRCVLWVVSGLSLAPWLYNACCGPSDGRLYITSRLRRSAQIPACVYVCACMRVYTCVYTCIRMCLEIEFTLNLFSEMGAELKHSLDPHAPLLWMFTMP